jgi:hypothetical protein
MISKQYIKDLEFKTIDDIYNYIVDSEINGAYSQFEKLINKLSKKQFLDFLNFLKYANYGNGEDSEIFKNKVLNARVF